MNSAAVIGEVASAVEAAGEGKVLLRLVVVGRDREDHVVLAVQAQGGQAAACRAYLQPGHRVAVEGEVVPGGEPCDIRAERVQFLTTRAQAEELRRAAA